MTERSDQVRLLACESKASWSGNLFMVISFLAGCTYCEGFSIKRVTSVGFISWLCSTYCCSSPIMLTFISVTGVSLTLSCFDIFYRFFVFIKNKTPNVGCSVFSV